MKFNCSGCADDKMGEVALDLRQVQTAAGAIDGKNFVYQV
jgi:hypothetical protein